MNNLLNKWLLSLSRITLLTVLLICLATNGFAKSNHLFKIATLAPEGSVWMQKFHDFADEVTKSSNGKIRFKVYPGGIMGDDQAMYRKMRVGQIHGGGFTMTGIAGIVEDFRVLALPFLFETYDEVDAVKRGLLPIFKKRFSEKKLTFVAMTEVGFVYAMGVSPLITIENLRNGKCWSPAGDPLTSTFLSSIGITPIQLSIPDVLSSLQTGLVNTVFNSLYGSIVLQWFTKAKYITETPYGYAYGVFLLDQRSFSKLSKEEQKLIGSAADKHFSILMEKTRQSNIASRQTLINHGVRFVETSDEVIAKLHQHREETVQKLSGKAFSSEIYSRTLEILNDHRKNNPLTK